MSDVLHALRRDDKEPALSEEAVQRTWRAISAKRARSPRRPSKLAAQSLVVVTVVLLAVMLWAAPWSSARRGIGAWTPAHGADTEPLASSATPAPSVDTSERAALAPEVEASAPPPEPSQGAIPAKDAAGRGAQARNVVKAGLGSRAPARALEWRGLALRGDYRAAYRALGEGGFLSEMMRGDVETLLLLADIARLSGHPADGAEALSRIVNGFPSDPRASLSAFTLGRLTLDSLGQPARAAASFKRALALGLGEALTEEARAGVVEALSRAGDGVGAREAAADYERRFSNGRYLKDVRRWAAAE